MSVPSTGVSPANVEEAKRGEPAFHVGTHRLLDDESLNFQLNRWIAYGSDFFLGDVRALAPRLTSYAAWIHEFLALAERLAAEGRSVDGALCLRSAEFFMSREDPRRVGARNRFVEVMRDAYGVRAGDCTRVPFEAGGLPAYRFSAQSPRDIVVFFGGFDSYVEEFFPLLRALQRNGSDVVAFEGPGQGGALEDGHLTMTPAWHRPVAAVLDHFELRAVTLIGLSLGGCLVIRAAATEKRIARVVAFDVLSDFRECMLRQAPQAIRAAAPALLHAHVGWVLDAAASRVARSSPVAEWGLPRARHVFGAATDHAALGEAARYHTRDVSSLVEQDVLLLAGAEDHYVPSHQLYDQAALLTRARSVTTRMFTQAESAGSHCQVGNLALALATITEWVQQIQASSSSRVNQPTLARGSSSC